MLGYRQQQEKCDEYNRRVNTKRGEDKDLDTQRVINRIQGWKEWENSQRGEMKSKKWYLKTYPKNKTGNYKTKNPNHDRIIIGAARPFSSTDTELWS